ncbi:class I SAM-dependent methyltransferase [Cyanobacterium sp. Dongsha4]|uniref:class I SAM-dependent methyltransferase n=1 Tax=Cyanobacterium sp. DS4 TaxID=2878255 RepID=UPI002E80474D|nr:class I SAM-dependent methyltransferase [Cyanobacterium sp. Dongsha4]WVL02238.1 class I SAM-dependent methyltransferase [Cyanobacterium sp. Dongsha4]
MEYIDYDFPNYLKLIDQEIDKQTYLPVEGNIYLEILSAFHETLNPQTYLEIGVSHGDSLRFAKNRIIGVDPNPQIQDNGEYLIYAKTSDLFFAEDANNLFQIAKIDLAFIDGMHLFEFALRDFINIEKYAHKNSYILIHDILPRCFSESSRARVTIDWTGDIWRLMIGLRKYRPDLNITVLDSYPTGLGIITNLNPESRILIDNYDEIVEELSQISTLSFIKARDLILHTFSTELYLMNFILENTL